MRTIAIRTIALIPKHNSFPGMGVWTYGFHGMRPTHGIPMNSIGWRTVHFAPLRGPIEFIGIPMDAYEFHRAAKGLFRSPSQPHRIHWNSYEFRSPGYTLSRKSRARSGPERPPGGTLWPTPGPTFSAKGIARAAEFIGIPMNSMGLRRGAE